MSRALSVIEKGTAGRIPGNSLTLLPLRCCASCNFARDVLNNAAFAAFGGTHTQGVRSQDTIDVDSEKDPRGFYRIKPNAALVPGEYGFILTGGFAAGAGSEDANVVRAVLLRDGQDCFAVAENEFCGHREVLYTVPGMG